MKDTNTIEQVKLIYGAIRDNFTHALVAEAQLRRGKKDGIENPGFVCGQRQDLHSKLKKLDSSEHLTAVEAVNRGHDKHNVSLDPDAKKALLEHALTNSEKGLSPFLPHRKSHSLEMNTSCAFFKAARKPGLTPEAKAANIAGGIIHGAKGFCEKAMLELAPSQEAVP